MTNFTNTSKHPTPVLRFLLNWVIQFQGGTVCLDCRVTDYRRGPFRGRAWGWGKCILLRIAAPERACWTVPTRHAYRKNAPHYETNGWVETFIALAAHELWHQHQFEETRKQRAAGQVVGRRARIEVEAEEQAYAAVCEFRRQHEALQDQIARLLAQEAVRQVQEKQKCLAKATPTSKTEAEVKKAEALLTTWVRKQKLANTKVRKYTKQVVRAQRKLELLRNPLAAELPAAANTGGE